MTTAAPPGYDAAAARSLQAEFESTRAQRAAEEQSSERSASFWRLAGAITAGILAADLLRGLIIWLVRRFVLQG